MGNVLRCFCLPFEEPQYTILTTKEANMYKSTEMPYFNHEEDRRGYTEISYFASEDPIFNLNDECPEYDIQRHNVYSRIYLQNRFCGWD